MLQIKSLRKSYADRVVLRNLSLDIKAGEIYGLLGCNGAGKTTTINILCQLTQADSGVITLAGRPHSNHTKSLVGLVPQKNLLYSSLTCAENLNFFARLYGLSQKHRRHQISRCLAAVGLADRTHCRAETLSGGMQRRLSMAIALIHHPKLLILDEPTTGLDLNARQELWSLIQELRQQGMTILLTTHLLDEAETFCDRLGILKQGQLVAEGTLDQLRKTIGAEAVIILKTTDRDRAIARIQALKYPYRETGEHFTLWPKKNISLKQIITLFNGIELTAVSCESIRLEHIYHEILHCSNPQLSSQQSSSHSKAPSSDPNTVNVSLKSIIEHK